MIGFTGFGPLRGSDCVHHSTQRSRLSDYLANSQKSRMSSLPTVRTIVWTDSTWEPIQDNSPSLSLTVSVEMRLETNESNANNAETHRLRVDDWDESYRLLISVGNDRWANRWAAYSEDRLPSIKTSIEESLASERSFFGSSALSDETNNESLDWVQPAMSSTQYSIQLLTTRLKKCLLFVPFLRLSETLIKINRISFIDGISELRLEAKALSWSQPIVYGMVYGIDWALNPSNIWHQLSLIAISFQSFAIPLFAFSSYSFFVRVFWFINISICSE